MLAVRVPVGVVLPVGDREAEVVEVKVAVELGVIEGVLVSVLEVLGVDGHTQDRVTLPFSPEEPAAPPPAPSPHFIQAVPVPSTPPLK